MLRIKQHLWAPTLNVNGRNTRCRTMTAAEAKLWGATIAEECSGVMIRDGAHTALRARGSGAARSRVQDQGRRALCADGDKTYCPVRDRVVERRDLAGRPGQGPSPHELRHLVAGHGASARRPGEVNRAKLLADRGDE